MSNRQSIEFQLELMMVHLEQMNKRLDMLEKTCMSLIEKSIAPAVPCPYHTIAKQHLDKRVEQEVLQEVKEKETSTKASKIVKDSYSMQRKAAI
jgi:hypothetical protein